MDDLTEAAVEANNFVRRVLPRTTPEEMRQRIQEFDASKDAIRAAMPPRSVPIKLVVPSAVNDAILFEPVEINLVRRTFPRTTPEEIRQRIQKFDASKDRILHAPLPRKSQGIPGPIVTMKLTRRVFPNTTRDEMLKRLASYNADPHAAYAQVQSAMRMRSAPKFKFKCPHCPAVFNGRNAADKHVHAVHDKRRPWKCTQCPQKFARKSMLECHVRAVHNKERPFQCTLCPDKFAKKSTLDSHVRAVHDKERPFQCTRCPKTFAEKGNLDQHVRAVHDKEQSFQCTICPNKFSRKGNLKRHLKDVHKVDQ